MQSWIDTTKYLYTNNHDRGGVEHLLNNSYTKINNSIAGVMVRNKVRQHGQHGLLYYDTYNKLDKMFNNRKTYNVVFSATVIIISLLFISIVHNMINFNKQI